MSKLPSKTEKEQNQEQTKDLVTGLATMYTGNPALANMATSATFGAIKVTAAIFGDGAAASLVNSIAGNQLSKQEAHIAVSAVKGETSAGDAVAKTIENRLSSTEVGQQISSVVHSFRNPGGLDLEASRIAAASLGKEMATAMKGDDRREEERPSFRL